MNINNCTQRPSLVYTGRYMYSIVKQEKTMFNHSRTDRLSEECQGRFGKVETSNSSLYSSQE